MQPAKHGEVYQKGEAFWVLYHDNTTEKLVACEDDNGNTVRAAPEKAYKEGKKNKTAVAVLSYPLVHTSSVKPVGYIDKNQVEDVAPEEYFNALTDDEKAGEEYLAEALEAIGVEEEEEGEKLSSATEALPLADVVELFDPDELKKGE